MTIIQPKTETLEGDGGQQRSKELSIVDLSKVPRHIAIIMDGNRRWARSRQLADLAGHCKGAAVLPDIVKVCLDAGIEILTVYAFSTENWSRSRAEVVGIFELFESYLAHQLDSMLLQGVRLKLIGDRQELPAQLRQKLEESIEITSSGRRLDLVLAINYGGRDDLCRAAKKVADDCLSGQLDRTSIDEKILSSYLDTAAWPDPELCIRTSGECRISNFMLWQLAYAEMVFSDALWPDFTPLDFLKAIAEFQKRKRRFGVN